MTKAMKVLVDLGYDNTITGTKIIEQAVLLAARDPSLDRSVSERLYIQAAESIDASPDSVGRCLRYATQKAMGKDWEARLEKVETKYGIYGLTDELIVPSGYTSPKKLILKLARALGDDAQTEV